MMVPRAEPILPSQRRWASNDSNGPPSSTQGTPAEQQGSDDVAIDALGDDALQQIFYGGKVEPREGDSGLTPAQEESLYQSGRIPSADEAEAEQLVPAATRLPAGAADKELGYKFALPPRPFPADFNHKKRYHPVVDLFARMMMRHGKLSAAHTVSRPLLVQSACSLWAVTVADT